MSRGTLQHGRADELGLSRFRGRLFVLVLPPRVVVDGVNLPSRPVFVTQRRWHVSRDYWEHRLRRLPHWQVHAINRSVHMHELS